MQNASAPERLKVRTEGEKVLVDVPWAHAEAFHAYLRRQGVEAILCADPAEHRAWLELPPGTTEDALRDFTAA